MKLTTPFYKEVRRNAIIPTNAPPSPPPALITCRPMEHLLSDLTQEYLFVSSERDTVHEFQVY